MSLAVFEIIKQFAANSSLSHALDYRDSRAVPIKFQFLLRFKIVVRSRWISNNTGWHPKTSAVPGDIDASGRSSNDMTQTCDLSAALCALTGPPHGLLAAITKNSASIHKAEPLPRFM